MDTQATANKYTLQYAIVHCPRIKRTNHVIKVLTDNDILDWDGLVNNPVPRKGLWKAEIDILNEFRQKELLIRQYRTNGLDDLKNLLRKYFSAHETSRVFNILKANKITSIRYLMSIHKEELGMIPGIGFITLDTIMWMKRDLWKAAQDQMCESIRRSVQRQIAMPLC